MAVATKPKPFTEHERTVLHRLLRTWFPTYAARCEAFQAQTGRVISPKVCSGYAIKYGAARYTGSMSPYAIRPEPCPRCQCVESKAYRGTWPPPRYDVPDLFDGGPICQLCKGYLEKLDREQRRAAQHSTATTTGKLADEHRVILRNLLKTWFRTHIQRADRFHELTGVRLTETQIRRYATKWRFQGYTGDQSEAAPHRRRPCDLCEEPGQYGRFLGRPYGISGRICVDCRAELDAERVQRANERAAALKATSSSTLPLAACVPYRPAERPSHTKQQIALALQADLHILNPEFRWRHLTGAAKAWKIRRVVAAKLAKVRTMPGYRAAEAAC